MPWDHNGDQMDAYGEPKDLSKEALERSFEAYSKSNLLTKGKRRKSSLLELEPLPESDPLFLYPPVIGGYWDSGYPRMHLELQSQMKSLETGAQLLLFRENMTEFRKLVLALRDEDWSEEVQRKTNAWLTGRERSVLQDQILLIYSDRDGRDVYEFPWYYNRFENLLDSFLTLLLGEDKHNIARLYISRMPQNTHIKKHRDYAAGRLHRLHLVLATSPLVSFHVCDDDATCLPLRLEQGLVFEFNNELYHYVDNEGVDPRIHLVIDVAESRRTRTRLKKGQVCDFVRGSVASIVC